MSQFFDNFLKSLKWVYVLVVFLCSSLTMMGTGNAPDSSILIISSYNPETPQTAGNISEFLDEYARLGGKSSVVIENMNCKSFSESNLWEGRMKNILSKYTGKIFPKVIILLGQEAWSAYLSQDTLLTRNVSVIGGMVSRNAVVLPRGEIDLENWEAESVDVVSDTVWKSQLSGFAYDYDIAGNVRLILDFYPNTKNIAFISDNSYGGVSLQAFMKKVMKEKFPDLNLILLDGRKHTIYSMSEEISKLPEQTAILIGTWRVDKNDGYFMRNATYTMMSANPNVPAFTATSIGMGHWTIGGYIPKYRTVGKDIALQAYTLETQRDSVLLKNGVELIPNEYCFDYAKLQKLGFEYKKFGENVQFYNKQLSYFEEYRYQIVTVVCVFILLLLGLLLALYFYFRTKRLKDDLEQSQKDNTLILNNVNTGIKFINPDFTVKWHNGVDFGISPEQILKSQGQVCYKALRGLDGPCDYCPAIIAMKSKKASEIIVERGDYFVYMVANPVFSDDEKLLGVVMRMEDITKQKHVEMELRLAKEKAEESDRLKSAFLANMSHEIRTPLNAIVGFSGVLTTDECDMESRQEYASIIQKNSDLLLRLINDILDISRLETGRLKFTFEEYEIVSVCRSVMATTSYGKRDQVAYLFEPPCEPFLLVTDVQRLQQILINLLSNANKFTEKGSITLGFEVCEAEDCVYFYVADTGCGIPENKQKRVFERFEKLDEYVQGTGLGLAICKLTITKMGGDIWVDKDYKEGARFVVRHPLHVDMNSGDF